MTMSRLFGTGLATLALGVVMIASTPSALAHHRDWHRGGPPTSAPEIDPSLARGALAVLAGGVMMLLGSRRRG
jgi:hypothetical protein